MLEAMQSRRSVRVYQPTPIPDSILNEMIRAHFCAPTANNMRPWQLTVVRDPKVKEALAQTHEWSGMIRQAPVCFVIGADENISPEFWIEDCSAGTENLMVEGAAHGIGTCWIAVRTGNRQGEPAEAYVRRVVGAPENIRILALVPAGYPAGEALPRDRNPEPGAVHWDRF